MMSLEGSDRPLWARSLSALLCGVSALLLSVVILYGMVMGTMPGPAELAFANDNWLLLPAHFLQTAPVLMCAGIFAVVLIALIATFASWRANLHLRAWWVFYAGVLAALLVVVTQTLAAQTAVGVQEHVAETQVVGDSLAELERKAPYVAAGIDQPVNVIVILAESLRHDLLGEYSAAAPFLNQLAADGVVYDKAYASSSHSNLSDLAFWYSQYPYRGQGHETYKQNDRWRGQSMFEAFKDSGYKVGYVSSQNEKWGQMINWLRLPAVDYFFHSEDYAGSTWENHDDEAGLASLIKAKVATAGKVEDSETLRVAADWLEANVGGGPAMLGMNLQNTHYSYVMPKGIAGPFQPADLGFKAIYYAWPEAEKENVRNRYLNAVYGLDVSLASFAKRLQAAGIWDESLVVIVGDNGEGFYEHGFGNHSGPLFDEATRTLAIIKPPKRMNKGGARVDTVVSHIDIAADTLDLAGVKVPQSFQGVPLSAGKHRPAFMYANAFVRQFGVVQWPWKLLISERPRQQVELYNLADDPAEKTDVSEIHTDVVDELGGAYSFWRESQFRFYRDGLYESHAPPRFVN